MQVQVSLLRKLLGPQVVATIPGRGYRFAIRLLLGTFYMSGSNTTTGRKGGTGTVTLKDGGKDAQVILDLQPQPGTAVKGTVTCSLLRY